MHYIYCVQKSNIIHILVYVVVGHGSKHVQLVLLPDMSGRCSGGFFAFTQGLVSLGFGLQWPPITRVTILRGFKRWTASSCSTYISQFHRCPLISFRHWTPILFPHLVSGPISWSLKNRLYRAITRLQAFSLVTGGRGKRTKFSSSTELPKLPTGSWIFFWKSIDVIARLDGCKASLQRCWPS